MFEVLMVIVAVNVFEKVTYQHLSIDISYVYSFETFIKIICLEFEILEGIVLGEDVGS